MAGMVRKNGFLFLWESLLAFSIMALCCAMAVTVWNWNAVRHDVDQLTREFILDTQRLREYVMGNGMDSNQLWRISITKDSYRMQNGTKIYKEVAYPPNARIEAGDVLKKVTFNTDGRPTNSMEIKISARDGSYSRKVVLAAQTGRIRVE